MKSRISKKAVLSNTDINRKVVDVDTLGKQPARL